jgi:pyrimidine deaminase RibD-like protein
VNRVVNNDILLTRVIELLSREWMSKSVGLVCAGIFDGDNEMIAPSISPETGKWIHAERNALNKFIQQFGTPSSSAVVVTTLSPCVVELKSRIGDSCTELLEITGLHTVHAGVLDSLQKDSLAIYRARSIEFSLTNDPLCKRVCERLLGMFETYGTRVNFELPLIKETINKVDIFS